MSLRPTNSDSNVDSYECQPTTVENFSNYTNHLQNVLFVVDNISSNAPKEGGFKMATYSEYSDPVYGLAQCRWDVGDKNCSTCLTDAAIYMSNNCPNLTKTAMVIRSICFLMYSNQNFFGQPYDSDPYFYCNRDKDPALSYRMGYLSKPLIANLNATAMFGKRSDETANGTVQAIVECRRDLTMANCTDCLNNATTNLLSNCDDALLGGYYFDSNCNVRYEID